MAVNCVTWSEERINEIIDIAIDLTNLKNEHLKEEGVARIRYLAERIQEDLEYMDVVKRVGDETMDDAIKRVRNEWGGKT